MSELRVVTGRASDLSGLWIAAVLLDNTVMTIGYEETQEEALAWGKKAMEARAWEGENKDPPDYYERKKQ
jgi:hypothetical protein